MKRPFPACLRALVLAWLGLAGCSSTKSEPPLPASSQDREIAAYLFRGQNDAASRLADSLMHSEVPREKERGLYWKAVSFLYRDEPERAVSILEPQRGKWSSGIREVHAEALLRLSRESVQTRANARAQRDEPSRPATQDKTLHEKIDALQKENGDMRTEITRLETEKKKYEKLLKDLETIR